VPKPGVAAQHRVAGQFLLPPEQAGMVGADLEGAIGIWGYWRLLAGQTELILSAT
jgi:hypothetical protein